MKVEGADRLQVNLRHLGETVLDRARKTMRRNADIIQAEAVLNAPHDTGALEQSIHQEMTKGDRDTGGHGGRLQIDIVVGGTVDGVDVDDYAAYVHENYNDDTAGPGTIAKREANPGRYIGRKFLERAFEKQREKLLRDTIDNINEVTRSWG